MLVWLASYPRSANTFARLLLQKLYGIPTYSIYDEREQGWSGLAPLLEYVPQKALLGWLQADPETHVVKTHDLPGSDMYPAIYLVRDGRDALVSYAHYILSFERPTDSRDYRKAFQRTLKGLIEDQGYFGGWSANVAAWSKRDRVAVVKFDDLIQDPVRIIEEALSSLAIDVPRQESTPLPSFADLQVLMPQFFRKGQTGSWRDEMSDDLHNLFWRHHGSVMERMGYERGPAVRRRPSRRSVRQNGSPGPGDSGAESARLQRAVEHQADLNRELTHLTSVQLLVIRELQRQLDGGASASGRFSSEQRGELLAELRTSKDEEQRKQAEIDRLEAAAAERLAHINEQSAWLDTLRASLGDKEREIQKLERATNERLQLAKSLEELNASLQERIAAVEAAFAVRSRELQTIAVQVQGKEEMIARLDAAATERLSLIEELTASVEALRAELTGKEQVIEELTASLEGLRADLDAKEQVIQGLLAVAEERLKLIQALDAQVASVMGK
jgi:hypothetical protein